MRTRVGVIPHIKKVSAVVLATIASLVLLASPTFALVGDVLISEFMADPITISDANGQWIELENTTSSDIDIAGWQLDDGGGAFVFTSPTIISANDFLVVCRNDMLADANCDVEWPGMELTNTGDTITLKDTTSTPVDALIYASSNVVEGASTEAETEGNGNQVLTANTDIANTYTTDNTGTPGAVNSFTLPVVNTDTGEEFNTIQAAINDTDTLNGHTLELAATTFTEAVDVTKELTIDGAGEGATIIDASAVNDYSMEVRVNNVTLKDFTLLGNSSGAAAYGVKVAFIPVGTQLTNFNISNVTVDSSKRTGIDLNGVVGANITDVTVRDVPSGNGISTTDSSNIVIANATTDNNAWGGVALYTEGGFFPAGSDSVSITGLNANEPNALYVQAPPSTPVTNISAPQFAYIVTNDEYRAGAENFLHYQRTLADATAFGLGLESVPPTNTDSAIRRVSDNFRVVPVDLTILAAVEDTEDGGTIELLDGTHQNDMQQIVINKSLFLKGSDSSNVTIQAMFSTGAADDARGWFLVNSGVILDVSNITFNGVSENIWQAFRHRGSGSFTNVVFKNIGYNPSTNYQGTAIVAFGDGAVNVDNSEFNNIGRIGVLYFGTGVSGSVFSNNTYTGKGAGDWLDYALDISAGAEVDVNSNNISSNLGVASSDSSSSAGVLVSTLFGPGTDATIQDNYFSGNTSGVAVGFNSSDTSTVVARGNTFDGNSFGAYSTNALADFRQNFWGDNSGPTDIDEFDGSLPATNPGGTGDIAGANIWYADWNIIDTDAPLMSNINMFVNGSDSDIAKAGDTVRIVADVVDPSGVDKVQIWVRDFPYTGQQITSGEMTLVSGDTYEFVFTLPADYQSGAPVQQTFDGNYYNFRPYDNLGNSIIGYRNNFTVDNTAPDQVQGVTIVQNTNDLGCYPFVNSRTITVKWNSSNDANFAYFDYQADADKNAPYDFTTQLSLEERTGQIRDLDGTYNYRVRAVDTVGNVGAWSDWCGVTLDRVAPDATNVSPFDGAIVNGASLTQQWSSSASDVDYYVYQSFNDDSGTNLRWQQNYNNTSKTATNVAESEFWWRVKAVDFAGNESAWTDLWMITVDNTAPVATIVTPLDTSTVNGVVTVEGQVDDANPMNSFFRITGPNSYNQTSLFTDGRTTHIYTWDTNTLDDGTYTITFETRDRALNKDGNSVTTIEVYLDNTSPVVTFDGVSTINQSPELSGAIDDDTATVEVTVNGVVYSATVNSGTWTIPAGTISPNLDVNTYDVEVESTDPSGNVNTQSFPSSLEIEAIPVVVATTTNVTPGVVAGVNTEGANTNEQNTDESNAVGTGGEPFVATQNATEIAQSEPQVEGENTPEVLQENISVDDVDVSGDLQEDDCFQIFGICWYWWLIPTAVLVAILYYYVIRKTDEE